MRCAGRAYRQELARERGQGQSPPPRLSQRFRVSRSKPRSSAMARHSRVGRRRGHAAGRRFALTSQEVARRQGIEISHDRFDFDVERLTRMLSAIEEEAAHVSDGEAPGGPRDHGDPPAPAGEGPQPAETTLTAPARVGLAGAAAWPDLRCFWRSPLPAPARRRARTRPPTADLVRPTALGAGASPSAPASSGTAANVAATPVVSTASLATLLADAPTAPRQALGPARPIRQPRWRRAQRRRSRPYLRTS